MSNALRTALDYVAQAQDRRAADIEAVDAAGMWAPRRAYEAGRIGTDINANNADIASMRNAGRMQEADALAQQNLALQQRQAMYAPEIARVEDVGSKQGYLRDGLSWFGTQLGQMAASAQDPMALAAAGTAVGKVVGAVPRLSAVGKAIQYGAQAGAFGLNQRQMTGEMYGRLADDPQALANMTPQEAYRTSNLYGLAAGAAESLLPGVVGHSLGGGALRAGAKAAAGRGAGMTLLGDAALEAGTELSQQWGQQQVHSAYNPTRDTSRDASELRNAAASGAAGGFGMGAPHAIADSAYGRAGRAGELVKEKTGEVVDLAREKGAQAYEDTGIKGVVDLGMQGGKSVLGSLGKVGKAAQDYMRDATGKINYAEGIKRAQADVERFKLSQKEADLLTAVPPAEADPDTLATWTEQNYADRTNYVFGKLEALERDGVQEATGFLDALESDDPVARTRAVDEATSFLLERNTAAQVRERATLFQAAIGEFIQKGAARMTRGAKAAGDAAAFAGLNVAEGVRQGLEGKKNMQGAGFSTLDYDTWKAWRDQNALPLGEDSQRAHSIQKAVEGRSRLKELRGLVPRPTDPEAAKRSYERAALFAEMLAAEANARRTKVMGHRVDEADGVIDYTNYVRSLAYEVEDMASSWAERAGAGTRPTGTDARQAGVALGLMDSMAEDLNNVLGPVAGDVVARMAQSAEPTAKAFFDVLQERVDNHQATMAERKVQDQTLQDQMLALLPQEHQATLREDGGAGARSLQQTVQMIARGRVPPAKRQEIEKAIGAGTLNRMLSLYGETVAPGTQVGTVVDDTGNEEIQNADMLTVTDDGEVDPNARIDDFEKRQAERKAARNSAPRMYAFYGEKAQSLRTTDSERRTARNPFEPLKRMSPADAAKAREAAAAAELAGEGGKPVIPNARPRLLRMDAEGAAEGIANKISQLEKTLGVDRTPENFFRLAKEELKGVAQAKKRESLAALEKAYAEGDEAAQARVAEMMERFFETRAGDYVVNAVSAKQVMDELGMPPSQRLAIFRDYMFQEGQRAREKDPVAAKRFYALARNAQAQLLDGGFEPNRGAAAENADTPMRSGIGIKRNVARLTAGERRTLQTAMERYFGEGYLVAAEQLSDRVPGTMAVGELLEMARKGNQAREAVRGDANKSGSGTVADAARAELEGSLLNFPQRAGVNLLGTKDATTLSIKASNLVAWVRNNRREDGADTKSDGKTKLGEEAQFLRDLQEGIATITSMDAIDGLPYVLGPDGEKQRFTDRGVPAALQLPNRAGKSFNRSKVERVAKAAGKDAPEPRSQMEVANDQMRSDDWFVADPLEGATDNVTIREGRTAQDTTVADYADRGRAVMRPRTVGEERTTRAGERMVDVPTAPVNRQANRDDADVSPLDTKLFLDAGQAEYDDQKLRSKDAGEGVGRESAVDAVKRAADRAGSIVAYTGPGREVTEGGTLTRVDRDIDARATLTNIQRRVIAARLGGLKGLERELTPKETALLKKYDGFASGKHYAYPLAHALSVKNVQDLLDSGAFSPAQMDFLIDQQRMAAQIINTAPAGARLQLARAMMDGREDVANYGQASQALTALAEGVSYKRAAPEVAATGAPKSQPKPGGVKLSGKTPFTPKDQAKADRATKFIGRGSERSSTAQYAKDFGALANTGSYTAADTVFVSAEGARAGRVEPDFAEIDRAVAAGATIITDNAENRAREYNVGERQVAAYLAKKGYTETSPGTWIYDDSKISTNYVHFNKQEANNFENWKNGPQARAAQGMATDADLKAAREYFDRVLGKQVKAEFENITGYSGEFIEADNLIKVSTLTNAGVMNVARHEALHAFFSKFIKANPKAVKVLSSLTDNERVLRRLQTLLKDEPAALEQLVDGEERLAYIYQFAMAGQLRLPHTPGTTLMHKIRKFLRRVFQMVSDDERAVDLLYAFEHGKMSDPSAGARALAKTLDQGTWATKGARSIDAITQGVAAMVLPANTILAQSASPTVRRIAKMFFTNPGEGGSANEGTGYLNERNQQMRRYDNLFRKAIDGLDADQLAELTEAMQRETPTDQLRDPDVQAAKEQLHVLFERFHRYLTDEKGLRIGKINESYFPVVWNIDKVREGKLNELLTGSKYRGEMQAMADAINAKRSANAEPISVAELASAISDHIARVNPLDDAELTPQRQDGVLRPWFASGEKRVLGFLSPEDRAQFQEKDIIKTLSRYVRQGVHAAEYSSRFGRQGKLLSRMLEDARGELEDASREMLAAGDLKNEKAREKWVKRQYRDVANAVGGMEGSLGHDISEGIRKINSWSIVYQNVRLLPLALFSSFVDPLGIVACGGEMREAFTTFTEGIKGVARQWADAIREEPADRQKSQWEELAEHAGVIDTATFSHLLADEYGSVYLDGTTKKINEVMFKANGMEAWNRAMRVGATRSAVRFMERHNKAPTEHSTRWMKDLGFEPGTLPLDSEGKLITDKRVMMSENPGMEMEEAEAKIAKVHSAINRWVEGAILSPNAAQRPAWGSDPHFSMFWHLKQFAYSFHETIMKRALNEAKHGNVMPLGVFAWYIPIMIAADVTKGLMLGAGELPAYMKGYDLGDWMLHGVERSGVLGIGQVAIDAAQEPLGIAGPMVEQITDIYYQPLAENVVRALPANALYAKALL